MWTYVQPTGQLFDPSGTMIAVGYSGAIGYKNQTQFQDIKDKGPIPCGIFTRGTMEATSEHGPDAIPLIPDPANEMFGRSGFWMHGDNIHTPGTASEGCIIQPKFARDRFNESDDDQLQVVKEMPTTT